MHIAFMVLIWDAATVATLVTVYCILAAIALAMDV